MTTANAYSQKGRTAEDNAWPHGSLGWIKAAAWRVGVAGPLAFFATLVVLSIAFHGWAFVREGVLPGWNDLVAAAVAPAVILCIFALPVAVLGAFANALLPTYRPFADMVTGAMAGGWLLGWGLVANMIDRARNGLDVWQPPASDYIVVVLFAVSGAIGGLVYWLLVGRPIGRRLNAG